MSRQHADSWSHPGHYLVDPYTWPWSPNGQDHIWPWKFKYQGHGQGQTHCQIWGLEFKTICLLFVSWQSDHFWQRYSQFHIWPWEFKVKVTANVKSDGPIWSLEFSRCVCFSFRGNRTIFGWDIANSIFDLENSRSRSRRKSPKSKKLFKSYRVDKNLRPAAAYEPVQKHKVTPSIPGWLN